MKDKRILVIDDEKDLCEIISFNLKMNGMTADVCHSAEDALKLDITKYDLILLDVMMEHMSGFEFAERLKENALTSKIPIIFLTAKDSEEDTLKGFDLGADDYITKPFGLKEMLARVKAVLKRTSRDEEDELKGRLYEYKGLVLNTENKTVTIDDEVVPMTLTEYELLKILISNPGHVFRREELVKMVWREDDKVHVRAVDVNITRIRKKIGSYAGCVVTRPKLGYNFCV